MNAIPKNLKDSCVPAGELAHECGLGVRDCLCPGGIARIWAFRAAHRIGSASSCGESGLNLFINDTRRIQVVDRPLPPTASPVDELERLRT